MLCPIRNYQFWKCILFSNSKYLVVYRSGSVCYPWCWTLAKSTLFFKSRFWSGDWTEGGKVWGGRWCRRWLHPSIVHLLDNSLQRAISSWLGQATTRLPLGLFALAKFAKQLCNGDFDAAEDPINDCHLQWRKMVKQKSTLNPSVSLRKTFCKLHEIIFERPDISSGSQYVL